MSNDATVPTTTPTLTALEWRDTTPTLAQAWANVGETRPRIPPAWTVELLDYADHTRLTVAALAAMTHEGTAASHVHAYRTSYGEVGLMSLANKPEISRMFSVEGELDPPRPRRQNPGTYAADRLIRALLLWSRRHAAMLAFVARKARENHAATLYTLVGELEAPPSEEEPELTTVARLSVAAATLVARLTEMDQVIGILALSSEENALASTDANNHKKLRLVG